MAFLLAYKLNSHLSSSSNGFAGAPRTTSSQSNLFSSAGVIESDRFEACLVVCSQRYRDCLHKANKLWRNFYNNMDIIRQIANRCCLFRATSQRAVETDSFSACAGIWCKASLWGCEIRKKHRCEISNSERRHLEEEMRYGNYTIPR